MQLLEKRWFFFLVLKVYKNFISIPKLEAIQMINHNIVDKHIGFIATIEYHTMMVMTKYGQKHQRGGTFSDEQKTQDGQEHPLEDSVYIIVYIRSQDGGSSLEGVSN